MFTQEADTSSSSSTPFSGSSSSALRSLKLHGVQALNDSTVWAAELTYPLTPAGGKGKRFWGFGGGGGGGA